MMSQTYKRTTFTNRKQTTNETEPSLHGTLPHRWGERGRPQEGQPRVSHHHHLDMSHYHHLVTTTLTSPAGESMAAPLPGEYGRPPFAPLPPSPANEIGLMYR